LRPGADGEGSFGAVRRVAVLVVLVLSLLAAPAHAARPTVPGELARLRDEGRIAAGQHDAWRATYDDAKAVWRRLTGPRRRELQGVLKATEALAARRHLTPERGPLVFETLERNRRWWPGGPLLGYGRRVRFAGSQLVWQMYPGQGLQLQWLGSFGRANGLFAFGGKDDELRALLDEALALAVPRAGGLGFESMFAWQGGAPGWVSAITQGTATQALSRAAVRLREPRLFEAARAATAPLAAPPPEGVRTPEGHLLMYSFAPRLRILNGFAQAVVGLSDFARFANDEPARQLLAATEARLRAELPRYDTGAWSLYRPGAEADLGYHRLQTGFLRGLCERLAVADYCEAAERFRRYERTPPVVEVEGARRRVRVRLDKRSTLALVVRRGRRTLLVRTLVLPRGAHAFAVRPGRAQVSARAVDLAGNAARTAAAVTIRR
jgi:hypothetical protein